MKKDDYIVFIVSMPSNKNKNDGMIKRELAIDSVFKNYKRIYIDTIFSFSLFRKEPKKCLKQISKFFKKTYKSNFANNNIELFYSIPMCFLNKLSKNAKLIYVHSLYSLLKLPYDFIKKYKDKIVIDIHGCVVEEEKYMGREYELLEEAEKIGFPIVKALITVSDKMKEFYLKKYPETVAKYITLPIFTSKNNVSIKKEEHEKLNLIYSGGVQKWQNPEIMAEIISKIYSEYNVEILTADIQKFSEILNKYNINDKVEIKTVDSSQIVNEYLKADLGFVLRDDIIVNQVACPTKIIEYMYYGIIPVVLQPNIGDFDKLGYSYILKDDLINGNLPSKEELNVMRQNNRKIIDKLNMLQDCAKSRLLSLIESCPSNLTSEANENIPPLTHNTLN